MAEKQYDNELRGALFKNDRKRNDKDPSYKGQCQVDGTEYWLAAWVQKDRNGDSYMSLSFTEKEERPAQRNPVAREPRRESRDEQRSRPSRDDDERPRSRSSGDTGFDDMDSDVPF